MNTIRSTSHSQRPPGRFLADYGNDRKIAPKNKGDARKSQNGGDGGGNSGNGGGPGGDGKNPPSLRPSRGLFGLVLAVTFAAMLFLVLSQLSVQAQPVEDWHDFQTLWTQGDLSKVEVKDDGVYADRRNPSGAPTPVFFRFSPTSDSRKFYLEEVKTLTNGKFNDRATPPWRTFLIQSIFIVGILALLWMLISRGLRSATGGAGGMLGTFGKSRHRTLNKEAVSVTFADVAGIEEAKDEVTEIIEFLKNPKRFMKLGGRIPRGVLLIGEPGCGKTLLAKAIAGEADVPFFSISGSDFVEMFVGVGASRVRDLFKQAKESAPCIIFLDEIDAVGRRRGGGFSHGGHDEREQTLNAILVEMDGFNSADGVIVVAATNRADVLDPALTRPGRFDRQITVPRPDVKGRVEILRVHAKKVKMGPDVDMERVARATPGFSGADLAAIINEAAIAATLHNKDFVEQEDLEEARDKVRWGRSRKSRTREKEENKLTAYHEAGHAVLQVLLPDADPLHKVTIIPRGNMGGVTFSLPEKDRYGYGVKWLRATMRMACGGRIAEEKAMGDASSGAMSDIAQVTAFARAMVLEWGMSEKLGFIRYAGVDTREQFIPEKEYSDETARLIDEEIKRIVDEAYADAKSMLEANWDKVIAVAEALIKYETLSADEVRKLMRGEPLGKPTVSDLLAAEARAAAQAASATGPRVQEPPPEIPPGVLPTPA
ncbi:MAG TPA: ATP-dependent zinc metalloprotease FtsH [Phycisphaerales bacterium]|nr:ATP-dependent zinc metalloprotease FtsH [Phycisphaerales bacterium]